VPEVPKSGKDTLMIQGEGWLDVQRTRDLWFNVFHGPTSLANRPREWVDKASVGIPYLYIATAASLAEADQRSGREDEAKRLIQTANRIARVTGLQQFIAPPPPESQPAVPLGDKGGVKITDSGKK
jgi:hypothetical protein